MTPGASRAIPIINPGDGTRVVLPRNARSYDEEWPEITGAVPRKSTNGSILHSSISTLSDPATSSSAKKDTDSPALDVYAKAYVPKAFRLINEFRPIFVYEAPNPRAIDYVRYIQSFGAYPYLQSRPSFEISRQTCLDRDQAFFETLDFLRYESEQRICENYEKHFECLIGREFANHTVEHKAQSLYNQTLHTLRPTVPDAGSKDLYTLVWPGILEDTPFIQAGDSIELRQLVRLKESTRLALMERWIKEVGQSHSTNGQLDTSKPLPPGWTGSSYTARVYTVIKAKETVVLFAPGLTGNMEFNVILPVQKKPYKEWLNSVAHFGRKLEKTSQAPSSEPWARKMLFPECDDGVQQEKLDSWSSKRKWFDPILNFEQQKAVRSICKRNYGIVPYLISGPPGTGKTKTLVETALQLIQLPATSHILVCAPSNAAADTLTDRLSQHLGPRELFRLNSPTRNTLEVPSKLRMYCHIATDESFNLPEFRHLMSFKVVVSSCQDASLLVDACVTNTDIVQFENSVMTAIHPTAPIQPYGLHWGALLLDEAAQAMEPQAIIPLSVIAPPAGSSVVVHPLFVMVGDEYQLGPRTYSHHLGLKTSLFARLFQRSLYAGHPLARKNRPPLQRDMLPMIRPPFTNLFRNYRSHPAILAVPSYSFYADTLLTSGQATASLATLDIWRGRQWPVLFVSNTGDEDHDRVGGGWFNNDEAKKAISIAQKVLSSGLIKEEDICIMSPFAAQVRLLRSVCRDHSLWNVNIGPCEAFQGQESRFVILCTTRARERFLDRDIEVCKGIIRQPQRMNVCLTRAQQGLVVIGNPKLLCVDPEWLRFMSFCQRNGLVKGEMKLDAVEDEQLRLESVMLAQDRDAEFDVEASARQLGVLTDDDLLWAQGLIAEDIIRQDDQEQADLFPTHL